MIGLGQYEEALVACDRAIALNPQVALTWVTRSAALDRLGQYDEALASYDRALALHPNDVEEWASKGLMQARNGHREDALVTYDPLALNPDDPRTLTLKGFTLWFLDRGERGAGSVQPRPGA